MSVFRIYPSKSNTIASGLFELYNSGQNAVTDLWYGGGQTNSSLPRRNSYSRFLMQFDLTGLQAKFNSKEIMSGNVQNYVLKMKNSIPRDILLEREYEFDRLDKIVSASYDLIVFPINKAWDEGRGYDLFEQNFLVKQKGNLLITGYSNWLSATTLTSWDEPGVFTNPTASTSLWTTQHFDIGDENLSMDITSIVNDWLTGGSSNYGVAVAYSRDFELISSDTRSIASFFTEDTNTAFKPYLEVNYNQIINDDRKQVSNNRTTRLFLYTFSGNTSANYFSAGTVDIKTASGTDVYTGLTPTQIEKGVYYVDVLMSSATPGQQYRDVWNDVSFVPGVDNQTFTQKFQIQKNYYNNSPKLNAYALSTYGLDNGSIVGLEEHVKVFCDLRVNYSTKSPTTAYILKYRVVMNNQETVIPWTQVNRTVRNDCIENYFEFDTSWLLHNQTYEIQFKIEEIGSSRVLPEKINFKVLRDF